MALIYCVEDDESIRELVLYAVKSSGYEAVGFSNDDDFKKMFIEKTPDLVLLDVMLPKSDGFAILSRIKNSTLYAKVPVIMLTAKSSEYDKVKGLDMGADDYIIKPFGVMELLSRIKAVLRRCVDDKSNSEISHREILINYDRHTVMISGSACELTLKEFELLYYLLKNKGMVLTREQIISKIWGFDFEGESRTIDMHIKTLRQKLQNGGCENFIKTIRGVGYKVE